MSTGAVENFWSDYEDHQIGLFAMREAFQEKIDESMAYGDLSRAAEASFGHSIVSYNLGDPKEGNTLMFMGCVLAHADIALAIEKSMPKTEDLNLPDNQVYLSIPRFIEETPSEGAAVPVTNKDGVVITWESGEWRHKEQYSRSEIAKSASAAQAAINASDILDPAEKNGVILNALHDIGYYMSTHHWQTGESFSLLKLAQQMTTHLDLNKDEESTAYAALAYEQLAAMGMYLEGPTIRVLVHALGGLQRIDRRLYAEPANKSRGVASNIRETRAAITSKTARTATIRQVQIAWQVCKDTVRQDNRFGPYPQSRPSRHFQHAAHWLLGAKYKGERVPEDILQLVKSLSSVKDVGEKVPSQVTATNS